MFTAVAQGNIFAQKPAVEVRYGTVPASVADPDPGSGIGCFLTPGSGIRDPE